MTFRLGALRAFPILAMVLWLSGCDDATSYNGPGLPVGYSKYQRDPNPVVKLDTDLGTIKIELFEDRCPDTVDNFVELTEQKYYDGKTFYRVIKDTFIFSGAKNADGTGGPGYTFHDEIGDENKNDQYAVGMVNESDAKGETKPNSNGSQFYIVTAPKGAHWLDKKNTVFGKVTDGKDVVDKINLAPLTGDKPTTPIKISKSEVVSKRHREYKLEEKSKNMDKPAPPPSTPRTITLPPGNYSPEKIKELQNNPPPATPPAPTVPAPKANVPANQNEPPKTGEQPKKAEAPKQPETPKQPDAPKQPEQPKKDEKPKTSEPAPK